MTPEDRRMRIANAYTMYSHAVEKYQTTPVVISTEKMYDFIMWLLENDEMIGTFVWNNLEGVKVI